jgi:hypothetical protein
VKNLVMFDEFSSSSWLGMNLARTVYFTEGAEKMNRLDAHGEIARILAVKPFSAPNAYRPRFVHPRTTGVAVLDQDYRPKNGGINFNSSVYPKVSDQYLSAVLHYWRDHPSVIAYAMSHNATSYVEDMNPDHIDRLEEPRICPSSVSPPEVPRLPTSRLIAAMMSNVSQAISANVRRVKLTKSAFMNVKEPRWGECKQVAISSAMARASTSNSAAIATPASGDSARIAGRPVACCPLSSGP